MLAMAVRRLGRRLTTVVGNFETAPIPRCDVITASFSLHHITTPAAKAKVFRKAYRALAPGGLLIDADCVTAVDARLQRKDMAAWHGHLAATHGKAGATKFLRAWAGEDTYFTLEQETALLRDAGFQVDVPWRRGALAVIAAAKPRRTGRRPARRA
jgi:SAM-dependent methyltransferase